MKYTSISYEVNTKEEEIEHKSSKNRKKSSTRNTIEIERKGLEPYLCVSSAAGFAGEGVAAGGVGGEELSTGGLAGTGGIAEVIVGGITTSKIGRRLLNKCYHI